VNRDALRRAYALKHTDRAGWLRVRDGAVESVAAHSWGMALLALARCPAALDRLAVLELCLVHDLPEALVGDITPHDGVPRAEKYRREAEAAADLFADSPALLRRWHEYADQRTPEARWVRQLDKLDMALQAHRYAAAGADTAEFLRSARPGIRDPALLQLFPDSTGSFPDTGQPSPDRGPPSLDTDRPFADEAGPRSTTETDRAGRTPTDG
jgi:putative hydrolases of HD superfamily